MSALFKIKDGTPTGDSLCNSCGNATIVKGHGGEHIIECAMLSGPRSNITFDVHQCTSYSDRRLASLGQLKAVAWIFTSDDSGEKKWFAPGSDKAVQCRYDSLENNPLAAASGD